MKQSKFLQLFILSFLLLSTHFEYTVQAAGPLIPILVRAGAAIGTAARGAGTAARGAGTAARGAGTAAVRGAGHVAGRGAGPSGKPTLHFVQHNSRKAAEEAAKHSGKGFFFLLLILIL